MASQGVTLTKAVARGHDELVEVQDRSIVYGCVQMSPFGKPPDPSGRCEQGAALSEKQMSFRSNATASGFAQHGPQPRHGMQSLRTSRGAALTRNAPRAWRTVLGPGCEASGLADRDNSNRVRLASESIQKHVSACSPELVLGIFLPLGLPPQASSVRLPRAVVYEVRSALRKPAGSGLFLRVGRSHGLANRHCHGATTVRPGASSPC
jgi:hypothetical protein